MNDTAKYKVTIVGDVTSPNADCLTFDGARIPPERTVVLSDEDVERIARRVVALLRLVEP